MNFRAGVSVAVAVGVDTRDTGQVPKPPAKPATERRKPTHTPPRSVRVPDEVWTAAKTEAARRGETVSDAVVRYLKRYGSGR